MKKHDFVLVFTSISPRFCRGTFGKGKKGGLSHKKWNFLLLTKSGGDFGGGFYEEILLVGFQVNLRKIL